MRAVGDRPGLRPLQRRSHALPKVRFARNGQTRGGTAFCPLSGLPGRGFLFCKEGENTVSERQKGTLFVFLAAVLYSIGGLCIKVIPWSGMAINGGRTAIAIVIVGFYLWKTGHKLRLNRWVLLGAMAVSGTNILFSVSNKLTTAANAIVLQFTAPIFVILISLMFLGKRPTKLDVMACVVVFSGVMCFFMDSISSGNLLGDILALISGISYAGVFMLNDLPDNDPISSVFFGQLCSAVIGFPFLLQETQFTSTALISLVILGVFQVALGYIFLTIGLKTTPPVTASLVSGIEPVLNPILVAVFYHEYIGPAALVGAVIVVGGVIVYNAILARQKAPSSI